MKRLIYDPQKKKAILIEPLGRRARQIYRQRIDAGENQASILPPELTYINGKFRKVKHISNFNNVRRITYQQVNSVFGDTQMNYNGGRRGRKTEEERQKIVEEYKLKVLKKKITLSFD